MSRCQRRIVSGVTSSRSPWWRPFGSTASRVASNARSAQSRFGPWLLPLQDGDLVAQDQDLCGLPRFLTPRQLQPRGRAHDQEEDEPQAHDRCPHGQTAGRATLQVTATDEILGTRNIG